MLFDAFISHASEDKNDFVRALAERLRKEHIEVWYDEFSLRLGDSLRRSIDRGLAQSRFGIVVLSKKNFFDKAWPQWELDGLVARDIEHRGTILPIWHGGGPSRCSSVFAFASRQASGIERRRSRRGGPEAMRGHTSSGGRPWSSPATISSRWGTARRSSPMTGGLMLQRLQNPTQWKAIGRSPWAGGRWGIPAARKLVGTG